MRSLFLTITFAFFSAAVLSNDADTKTASTTSPKEFNYRIALAAESLYTTIDPHGLNLHPRFEFDYFNGHWVLLLEYAKYSVLNSGNRLDRREMIFGLGRTFLERKLKVFGKLGNASTGRRDFDDDSRSLVGLGTSYSHYIWKDRFEVFGSAGWSWIDSGHILHDTGQARTKDTTTNTICSILTLGFSNDCGNKIDEIKYPSSQNYYLGLGVGYRF